MSGRSIKLTDTLTPTRQLNIPAALSTAKSHSTHRRAASSQPFYVRTTLVQLCFECETCPYNSLLIDNRFDFRVYNLNRKMFMLKSALTAQILVLTARTASFNIKKTTFCPHSIFVCFVWISEQTAIISLYRIK
jgi:hypothetical protein